MSSPGLDLQALEAQDLGLVSNVDVRAESRTPARPAALRVGVSHLSEQVQAPCARYPAGW